MHRTVLKVPMTSQKCQTDIMKAVAKLDGIEKMELDVSKGTLTIIGEIEPVPIFKNLKKIGKQPEIISVGPPLPKCPVYCTCNLCRPNVECTPLPLHFPSYNNNCFPAYYSNKPCEFVAVEYPPPCDGPGQCTII